MPDLQKIPFILNDALNEKEPISGHIKICAECILINFDGYSTATEEDNEGYPVYIENCLGAPKVVVWDDINEEEPGYIIKLDTAAVNLRKDEDI